MKYLRQLVSADRVSVASFQHSAFLGLGLANLLQQVRPHVAFSDGADSACVDMLLDSGKNSCVVLIDQRRYFRQFREVAEQVARRGIPLVLIADIECYWARELTPHALLIPASEVWHSYCAMSSLFSLIVAAVTEQSDGVMKRLSEINKLRQGLGCYIDPPRGKARKKPNR